jgi:hypothetical protein
VPSPTRSGSVRLRVWLVAVLVLSGGGSLGVASRALAQDGELVIVKPDELKVAYEAEETDPYTVWIRNTGATEAEVQFTANVQDSSRKGEAVTAASTNTKLAPQHVERFHVTFASVDKGRLSGELVARAEGFAPGTIDLEIGPKRNIGGAINALIGGALAVALILTVVRWFTLKGPLGVGLGSPVGPAKFDFTKSFASTITLVGAVLGTVLTAGLVPEQPEHLTKDEYLSINLLFGVMVVVGTIVFAMSERPDKDKAPKAGEERLYEGAVWALLVSAGLVVWAVAGEVACIALIVSELDATGAFTALAIYVFWGLLGLAAIATLTYTYRRIYWVIENCAAMKHQVDAQGTRSAPQATSSWAFF